MKNLVFRYEKFNSFGGKWHCMIAISIAKELGIYTIGGFLNDIVPVGNRLANMKSIL